jgi:phthiodiolone/phenolphthiodiolone dimycocerosates ketoreductase
VSYEVDPESCAAALGTIRAAAAEAGRDPADVRAGLFAWLVVDEGGETAARTLDSLLLRLIALTASAEVFATAGAGHPLQAAWGLMTYVPTRLTREEGPGAAAAVPEEVLRRYYIHGTPDDVVERLRGFREAGLEHACLVNVTALADPSKAAGSTALVEDVMRGLKALP